MKRWKKGLLAAAAVLALGLLLPAFGSPSTVYFMAINDRVHEMTAENMPMVMGGELYVPYTMLSYQASGINLGVNAMYSSTQRTALVSNGQKGIIFDPQSNTAQDLDGNDVPVRAMTRNAMVFLPIDYLCDYFGTISCSRVRTPYGTLVRVTNGSAFLSDSSFVSAADTLLADNLQRYLANPGSYTSANPSDPMPNDSEPPGWAELYLAFRWGEQGADTAKLLEDRGERALFLFTCDELRGQDDAVRRVIGAGHTVGLALTGADGADCRAEAEEGRRLLAAIARYPLLVVGAGGLDEDGREAVTEAGFAVWAPVVRGEDYASGSALVRSLDPEQVNLVELSCGPGGLAFARGTLQAMDGENCRAYQFTPASLQAG